MIKALAYVSCCSLFAVECRLNEITTIKAHNCYFSMFFYNIHLLCFPYGKILHY